MEYRDYEKFFTPADIAYFMVSILNPKSGQTILEPSAGNGALIKAIKSFDKSVLTYAVELNPIHEPALRSLADNYSIGDFLLEFFDEDFDGCIANPPFGNGIQLDEHIYKICSLIRKGGRIVLIVPEDYIPDVPHMCYPVQNWSANSDGTTTPIKIISFVK